MRALYITYMGITEPLQYSQVLGYLKGLARKDISIYLLSFEKKTFLMKSNINQIREELKDSKIKWYFLKYHKRPQFLAKAIDIFSGMIASFIIAVKEKIDVVHARNTMCALMGSLPIIFLNKKFIFDIRGFMAEEYADGNLWEKDSMLYKIVNWLERYFIRKADEIIVLTQKAKDLLADKNNKAGITIIPTCVDLENFIPNRVPTGRVAVVYTGSIGTWYMLKEMVDFYKALLETNRDAKFLIITHSDHNMIKRDVLKDTEGNIFIKMANPKEVPAHLNRSDMGIFFIKPCFSKAASCPTKFAEYLACGLPVIISRGIGDTERIVKENNIGVVVEDFSAIEYKRAIFKLNELLIERDSLRDRCRKVAEKYFSLQEGVEKYFSAYKRLT